MVLLLIQALWFILPAYAANAFPPMLKGKRVLDFGKRLHKHRILGDGKTIEGTVGGILFGFFIGLIQIYVQGFIPAEWELNLIEMSLLLIFLLSIGAVIGDILGSFAKRRFSIKRGEPAPLLDQLDFLVFAILSANLILSIKTEIIIVLLIITPPLHWVTNLVGYFAKIKKTPW